MSPEVQTVLEFLPDYKRGALGPVQHLEAPLWNYLRMAERGEDAWQARQLSQGSRKPRGK